MPSNSISVLSQQCSVVVTKPLHVWIIWRPMVWQNLEILELLGKPFWCDKRFEISEWSYKILLMWQCLEIPEWSHKGPLALRYLNGVTKPQDICMVKSTFNVAMSWNILMSQKCPFDMIKFIKISKWTQEGVTAEL